MGTSLQYVHAPPQLASTCDLMMTRLCIPFVFSPHPRIMSPLSSSSAAHSLFNRYYPATVVEQVLLCAFLNMLTRWPVTQSLLICFLMGVSMVSVSLRAPYVLFGDTRADMYNFTTRFLTHIFALMVALDAMNPNSAASTMIFAQLLAVAQTVATQLAPMREALLPLAEAFCALILPEVVVEKPVIEEDNEGNASRILRKRLDLGGGRAVVVDVPIDSIALSVSADVVLKGKKDSSRTKQRKSAARFEPGDGDAEIGEANSRDEAALLAARKAATEGLCNSGNAFLDTYALKAVDAYATAAASCIRESGGAAAIEGWLEATDTAGVEGVMASEAIFLQAHMLGLAAMRSAIILISFAHKELSEEESLAQVQSTLKAADSLDDGSRGPFTSLAVSRVILSDQVVASALGAAEGAPASKAVAKKRIEKHAGDSCSGRESPDDLKAYPGATQAVASAVALASGTPLVAAASGPILSSAVEATRLRLTPVRALDGSRKVATGRVGRRVTYASKPPPRTSKASTASFNSSIELVGMGTKQTGSIGATANPGDNHGGGAGAAITMPEILQRAGLEK